MKRPLLVFLIRLQTFRGQIAPSDVAIRHVAQALVLGLAEFLTFEARQGKLAKAAVLKVPKLSRGGRTLRVRLPELTQPFNRSRSVRATS
jgi:hypothetical protein